VSAPGRCIGQAPLLFQDQNKFRSEPPSHSISPKSGFLWLSSFPPDKKRDRPRPLHSSPFRSIIRQSMYDFGATNSAAQQTKILGCWPTLAN